MSTTSGMTSVSVRFEDPPSGPYKRGCYSFPPFRLPASNIQIESYLSRVRLLWPLLVIGFKSKLPTIKLAYNNPSCSYSCSCSALVQKIFLARDSCSSSSSCCCSGSIVHFPLFGYDPGSALQSWFHIRNWNCLDDDQHFKDDSIFFLKLP